MIQAIGGGFQASVTVASNLLNDVDGLDKVFKCAKSAFDLYGKAWKSLSEGFLALGNCFKVCTNIMGPFQLFRTVKDWYDVRTKNWAGIATLTCVSALTVMGIGRFLESVKLFDYSAAVSRIGNIPVLGSVITRLPVVNLLSLGVSAFNITDNAIELSDTLPELQQRQTELNHWTARRNTFFGAPAAPLNLPQHGVWAQRMAFQAAAVGHNAEANAYLNYRVEKAQVNETNTKVKKIKSILSIISDASKIAALALTVFLSWYWSMTLMAVASTVTVLSAGVIVASIALVKKIYDVSHKEIPRPVLNQNVVNFAGANQLII